METVLCVFGNPIAIESLEGIGKPSQLQVLFAEDLDSATEILRERAVHAILLCPPRAESDLTALVNRVRATGTSAPILVYQPSETNKPRLAVAGLARHIANAAPADELHQILVSAIREHRAAAANATSLSGETWSKALVGSSAQMREIVEIIRLVSSRRSTVLITGETGTGKEIAARSIHAASNRSGQRMVAINCAALPDHLLEAELFGHTKGAFTGAVNARTGLFEQAHRGTIFLDEIGEMPLQLQAKLLRVLQEREIQRIGSSETIQVDVRVIAASNQNLAEAVAQRRFREDLYYRLNVVALRMPALRERPTDVAELAAHFLRKISDQEGTPLKELTPSAIAMLSRHSWPGNVRQLEHALEAAAALSGLRTILHPADFDLPCEISNGDMVPLSLLDVPESGINFEELIMGIERRLLERALQKSGGNKARAASLLQMKRTTLISKFKALEVCA